MQSFATTGGGSKSVWIENKYKTTIWTKTIWRAILENELTQFIEKTKKKNKCSTVCLHLKKTYNYNLQNEYLIYKKNNRKTKKTMIQDIQWLCLKQSNTTDKTK